MTAEPTFTVLPASEVSWSDIQAVFGSGHASRCQCQRFKVGRYEWTPALEERAARLRDEAGCDDPEASSTCGLVAFLDDEPVGWCAVEPRTAYPVLLTSRSPVVWKGRGDEERDDDRVWAVTCFVTRVGYRRRGVTAALVRAAVDHARANDARALEGYPMATVPGKEITWGELFVGSRSAFADAGFREVSHPTPRRYVMRVDF